MSVSKAAPDLRPRLPASVTRYLVPVAGAVAGAAVVAGGTVGVVVAAGGAGAVVAGVAGAVAGLTAAGAFVPVGHVPFLTT